MDLHTRPDRDRHSLRDELGARTRLYQAHDHWHRALVNYPFVDRFFVDVNALIPSLRSVTFVLQKNLRHHDGFDEWYAPWQQRMKDDAVMRWLVEARNHIEKIGDLELRSTARVSVTVSWDDAPVDDFDVPPLMPPHLIAEAISQRDIPDQVRRDGVLRVERRWVAPDLPDKEVLDACAHGWGFLDGLLEDAESRFLGRPADSEPLQVRRPECMTFGPDARSALLHMASGAFMERESVPHLPSEDELATVEERYGDAIRAIPRENDTLRGRVRWYHELARVLLVRDGHHISVAFIRRHGSTIRTVELTPEDQQQKYLLMDQLASEVEATGADEIVFTSEVWFAPHVPPDDPRFGLRAEQREDRREALSTLGATREGELASLHSTFTRDGQRIVLVEPVETVVSIALSIRPVLKVWGIDPLTHDESSRESGPSEGSR